MIAVTVGGSKIPLNSSLSQSEMEGVEKPDLK